MASTAARGVRKDGRPFGIDDHRTFTAIGPIMITGLRYLPACEWRLWLRTIGDRRDIGLLPRQLFRCRSNLMERGQKVGKVNIGQDQSDDPEYGLKRKKGQETEQCDNVELKFPLLVRNGHRERMNRQDNDAEKHDHGNDEDQRDIVEHVGFARAVRAIVFDAAGGALISVSGPRPRRGLSSSDVNAAVREIF
jgi:hypothetical protein